MDINSSVKLCTQIALENNHILKVKTLELLDVDHISVNKELLSNIIAVSLMDVPLIQVNQIEVIIFCSLYTLISD